MCIFVGKYGLIKSSFTKENLISMRLMETKDFKQETFLRSSMSKNQTNFKLWKKVVSLACSCEKIRFSINFSQKKLQAVMCKSWMAGATIKYFNFKVTFQGKDSILEWISYFQIRKTISYGNLVNICWDLKKFDKVALYLFEKSPFDHLISYAVYS